MLAVFFLETIDSNEIDDDIPALPGAGGGGADGSGGRHAAEPGNETRGAGFAKQSGDADPCGGNATNPVRDCIADLLLRVVPGFPFMGGSDVCAAGDFDRQCNRGAAGALLAE